MYILRSFILQPFELSVTNLYPAKILYCMMVRQFQGILWYGTHQHHQYSAVYFTFIFFLKIQLTTYVLHLYVEDNHHSITSYTYVILYHVS